MSFLSDGWGILDQLAASWGHFPNPLIPKIFKIDICSWLNTACKSVTEYLRECLENC